MSEPLWTPQNTSPHGYGDGATQADKGRRLDNRCLWWVFAFRLVEPWWDL